MDWWTLKGARQKYAGKKLRQVIEKNQARRTRSSASKLEQAGHPVRQVGILTIDCRRLGHSAGLALEVLDESTNDSKLLLAFGASELIFVMGCGVQVGVERVELLELLLTKTALVRLTIEAITSSEERRRRVVVWCCSRDSLYGKVWDNLCSMDCSGDLATGNAVAP